MAIVKKQIKSKVFKVVKPVGENDKCPPQSKLIVNTIVTAGGAIDRDELMTLLKRPPAEGGLTTNQTAERILGFYTPKLVDMGVLEIETKTTEIDVEVPDKPAKAPKAPKAEAPAGEATIEAAASSGPAPEAASDVKGKKGKKKEEGAASA